jgi:thiosulfate/3-mercaptopyruvate sulfurtransferase
LWQFKIYGHADVRLIDGGRKKWEIEQRPYTTQIPVYPSAIYHAKDPDLSIRSFRDDFKDDIANINLVDVRSPDEFSGKVISPPGLNETAQRGGHIPGAKNVPWALAVNPEGAFKSVEELSAIYDATGLDRNKDTVAYCRIGERSSHTWFVLKYLLGFKNVSNYDGSWTEWGNIVGAPIEK